MEFLEQLLVQLNSLNKPLVFVQNNGGVDSMQDGYKSLAEQRCEGIIYIADCNGKAEIYSQKIKTLGKENQILTVLISELQDNTCCLMLHNCSNSDEFEEYHLPIDESIEQVMASFKN